MSPRATNRTSIVILPRVVVEAEGRMVVAVAGEETAAGAVDVPEAADAGVVAADAVAGAADTVVAMAEEAAEDTRFFATIHGNLNNSNNKKGYGTGRSLFLRQDQTMQLCSRVILRPWPWLVAPSTTASLA